MFIETERLILRPFKESDAKDLYEYLKAPEVHCFYDMRIKSLEHALEESKKRAQDDLYVAVEVKDTGMVIGEVFSHAEGTNPSDSVQDTYSPCWMLNPDYKGMGYGYEAAHAYIDYLFHEMGARRVYMYTEDYNVSCQKLCEKLGARQEALYKEFVSFVQDKEGNPIYENTYEYAILKKEWMGCVMRI